MSVEVQAFPIEIEDNALSHIKRIMARKATPDAFFRVGVKGGGCSGFEYAFLPDTNRRPTDFSVEIDGLEVRIDPNSARFLRGAILKFTGNLLGPGLQFENPNAARSCGCGTSFTPRE